MGRKETKIMHVLMCIHAHKPNLLIIQNPTP